MNINSKRSFPSHWPGRPPKRLHWWEQERARATSNISNTISMNKVQHYKDKYWRNMRIMQTCQSCCLLCIRKLRFKRILSATTLLLEDSSLWLRSTAFEKLSLLFDLEREPCGKNSLLLGFLERYVFRWVSTRLRSPNGKTTCQVSRILCP